MPQHTDPDRDEVRTMAAKEATPINELIDPDDVQAGADSWDAIDEDRMEMELAESASVIRRESQAPFSHHAHELMLQLVREALTRAPMDDLVFEDERDAVLAGYWPNRMNKWDVEEHITEARPGPDDDLQYIKQSCLDEAWDVVAGGIVDGMRPDAAEA